MVLQYLAVGRSLNKLDFSRTFPGNTSVNRDIQFLWLSNYIHVGNIHYMPLDAQQAHVNKEDLLRCHHKAVLFLPLTILTSPLCGLVFPLLVDEIFWSLSEFLPCGPLCEQRCLYSYWLLTFPSSCSGCLVAPPVIWGLFAAPGSPLRRDLSPLHTSFLFQ